jgi:hypothetical protein
LTPLAVSAQPAARRPAHFLEHAVPLVLLPDGGVQTGRLGFRVQRIDPVNASPFVGAVQVAGGGGGTVGGGFQRLLEAVLSFEIFELGFARLFPWRGGGRTGRLSSWSHHTRLAFCNFKHFD